MRHMLTLIASPNDRALRAETAFVAHLHAELNPIRVVWLSDHACDFELEYEPSAHMLAHVLRVADEAKIDAVIQPLEGRAKKLLISDMDSTMIAQECIDELADMVGMRAHVAAITERAMNGELDFKEALRERVALLKGLNLSDLEKTYRDRITLMPGARTLVQTLRSRGVKSILVSGGFGFFTSRVAEALGFDANEANTLLVKDRKLTGEVKQPILDKDAKRATLLRVAAKQNIPLPATLAVGDGANDLPMLLTAGLGVAYHAKPVVEAQARASIRHNDLTALLYLQGIPQNQWKLN